MRHLTNDNYFFQNTTINIINRDTKAQVFTLTVNDTTLLSSMRELPDLAGLPMLLSAQIQAGKLNAYVLWNNYKRYIVVNDGGLLLPFDHYADTAKVEMEDDILPQLSYYLSPLATLTEDNNNIYLYYYVFAEVYFLYDKQ